MLGKFMRQMVHEVTVLDRKLQESELLLMEEQKRCLQLQHHCDVQRTELIEVKERLGNAHDTILSLDKNQQPQFTIGKTKSFIEVAMQQNGWWTLYF